MILIGLGAKARQGKNYAADYMKDVCNDIKLYSYADELKKYCREHHDELLPQWQLANQTKQIPFKKDDPIYGYTPILQWFGTDVIRKQSPNQWIMCVADKITFDKPTIAIITDVRFPNEAAWVKNHDGYLIEVIRINKDGTRYYDPNRDKTHISETALDDYLGFDFVIRCQSGDLDSLRYKSQRVLETILDQSRPDYSSVPDATGCSSDF